MFPSFSPFSVSSNDLLRMARQEDAAMRAARENEFMKELAAKQQASELDAKSRAEVASIQAMGNPYDRAKAALVGNEMTQGGRRLAFANALAQSQNAELQAAALDMFNQGLSSQPTQAPPPASIGSLFGDSGSIQISNAPIPFGPGVNLDRGSQTVPPPAASKPGQTTQVDPEQTRVRQSREKATVAPIEEQYTKDMAEFGGDTGGRDEAEEARADAFVAMILNGQLSMSSPLIAKIMKQSDENTPTGMETMRQRMVRLLQANAKHTQNMQKFRSRYTDEGIDKNAYDFALIPALRRLFNNP